MLLVVLDIKLQYAEFHMAHDDSNVNLVIATGITVMSEFPGELSLCMHCLIDIFCKRLFLYECFIYFNFLL